jgi:CheY-like chemotaxis protein/HPt (histidine-containing phosphotransfer) domain-containing protein
MRRSYMGKLEAWGCRVEPAENAEVGLVMLEEAAAAGDPFRFALIERQLPGMDGEEMGAAIRADGTCDHTLTVLVTSAGRRGDAARARARGFSAYLSKPLDWEQLAGALSEVLRRTEAATAGETPELVTLHSIAETRRSNLRILLVEDSAVNQLVTQWTLKRLGYGLQIATSASAALEAWRQQPFDLVLMDIRLPDGDGYALAGTLRSSESPGRRVPIVAMTGSAGPGEREKCLAAGMDEYLPKPVDLGLLCRVVENLTGMGSDLDAEPAGAAPSREAADPGKVTVAADDAPLLRELEAAEAELSGVRGQGARVETEAGLDDTPPRRFEGFAGTHAAEILETGCAGQPAEAAALARNEFQAVAAEAAAARVAGLSPTVDSLSSADVLPLDGDLLRDEITTGVPHPALDLERLEETCMGIPALRESLLNTFLSDVRPRLEQLGLAVNGREARRVEFEAHGLKGMCATVGAAACAELFAELERVGREKTLEQAAPLLKRAYLEVTRTERYITTMERQAA